MGNLGERIKIIRTSLKLNQLDFALKIGLESATAISKYEDNSRQPDIDKLIKISELGNISLDELLTGDKIEYKNHQNNTHIIKEASEDYPEIKISEAMRMCAAVIESKTSYATALYHNLVHFDRAVKNEQEHNTCKADLEKANKTISEMRTRVDGMDEELKTVKKELKKLLEHSGGSAPIKLTMDHAAPTGTEDKET